VRKRQVEDKMAFCRISFNLFLDKGENPRYRIYVNDELFAERTYIWKEPKYLQENLQINAEPGEYTIKIEKIDPAKFRIRNTTVTHGSAEIIDSTTFRIL
jgi:hypothetical protein